MNWYKIYLLDQNYHKRQILKSQVQFCYLFVGEKQLIVDFYKHSFEIHVIKPYMKDIVLLLREFWTLTFTVRDKFLTSSWTFKIPDFLMQIIQTHYNDLNEFRIILYVDQALKKFSRSARQMYTKIKANYDVTFILIGWFI